MLLKYLTRIHNVTGKNTFASILSNSESRPYLEIFNDVMVLLNN